MTLFLIIFVTILFCSFTARTVSHSLTAWIPLWKWETNPKWVAPAVKGTIFVLIHGVVIFCTFCLGFVMLCVMGGKK